MKARIFIPFILGVLLAIGGCSFQSASQSATEPVEQTNPTPPPPPPPKKVRITAFGDVMMHTPQIRAGKQAEGQYQFDSFFQEVKPILSSADVTIGNFETVLAGSQKGYHGYPLFNAPDALADSLHHAGVDLVSTANNHALDQGTNGLIRTYQTLTQKQLLPVGTAPTSAERKPTFVEKNGVKMAFLAYTQSTNGLPIPTDKPYLVNKIDFNQIEQDIQTVRTEGVDAIFVSLHFGDEYLRQPNKYQEDTAMKILDLGADVILGSHPHVVQPIKEVEVNGKKKLIVYSMGNFISNQTKTYTDEGIIVMIDLLKEHDETKIEAVSYLPTYVHQFYQNGKKNYVILPLDSKEVHPSLQYPGINQAKWTSARQHTVSQMNQAIPVFSSTP
ncbi:CapA family protein [Hazenella sp. IB182357]|uniref:CapA family protein n=1 Tax=Polycladospora coralii TaxID=2771432 RepID=A0A926NGI2_9BACL|nr:CapA family protein [Polycladospora coralii]MBD1372918.1 CapA family protein [Polycladospora coralii]